MRPFVTADLISAWQWNVAATLVIAIGVGCYWALTRRTVGWPWRRTAAFVLAGGGTAVVATMSSVQVYATRLSWAAACQYTLLLTVVPLGIAGGRPLDLLMQAFPPADRLARSWPLRVLTFPLVGAVAGVAIQLGCYFTGWFQQSLSTSWGHGLTEMAFVAAGSLFALPVLGDARPPRWCTAPVRLLFGFADGLLDAVPGIALMTAGTVLARGHFARLGGYWAGDLSGRQVAAGQAALGLAELAALPLLLALLVQWVREDEAAAARHDAATAPAVTRPSGVARGAQDLPALETPWWEIDPGPLADRAERYGWKRSGA